MADYRTRGDGMFAKGATIGRHTHYGIESIKSDEMTLVYYRDGRILVNREIVEQHPKVVYRAWADKDLPSWMKR